MDVTDVFTLKIASFRINELLPPLETCPYHAVGIDNERSKKGGRVDAFSLSLIQSFFSLLYAMSKTEE